MLLVPSACGRQNCSQAHDSPFVAWESGYLAIGGGRLVRESSIDQIGSS